MPKRPSFCYRRWWSLRLRPGMVRSELSRLSKKISRRLLPKKSSVAHIPARATSRGRALVSYLAAPCLGDLNRELPHSHTHFWESRQIALTFAELGFDVDVIDWTDHRFQPHQPYDVVLDVRLNLERLASSVGDECLLIQHMETAHYRFHNAAQRERLDALERRRGVRIRPQRLLEENRAIDVAHFGTTVGNEFTIETYSYAGKEIFRIPISTPVTFSWPDRKDFESVRHNWLWFGSGGLVHKGLDRVLEAFAGLPDHHLTVCAPVHLERDFEAEYARELYGTPNIHTEGFVDVFGERFRSIVDRTLGVVYPSCSEGGGGSVITCMHAGLLPLVTRESSVDLDDFGFLLDDPEVATIRRQVEAISSLPGTELARRSRLAWEHVRQRHTREAFARNCRAAIESLLTSWVARRQERS